MSLQKVNRIGRSKAIVIPCGFFDYWETKGKTFTEMMVHITEDMEKIILAPVFKDMEEGKEK
jgi:hypothetical protein